MGIVRRYWIVRIAWTIQRLRYFLLALFAFLAFNNCLAQSFVANSSDNSVHERYNKAFEVLDSILATNGEFKSAVFAVENVFYSNALDSKKFENSIQQLCKLCKYVKKSNSKIAYSKADSNNYLLNYSIFSVIHDTVYILSDSSFLGHRPYRYDFVDPSGKADWSNMFVHKLLVTHKGNCRSLAYLYKILADELGAKCWLALAPSHIYIRNYSQEIGWYNSELTSGIFPTDAWIALTGYVSTDAIRSGVYMDTLSNQQSIALCALDLAKAYEFQAHNYCDGFVLKCCDLALRYYSTNPLALLLKAETLQKLYFQEKDEQRPEASSTYAEMENIYIGLAKMGYRQMPEKMYIQWLQSGMKVKDKFSNKQIRRVTPTK